MISDETRQKLREAAIKNGFGLGVILVDLICVKCDNSYKGNPNQLICNNCKRHGYNSTCKHCNKVYKSYGNDTTMCCTDCKLSKPWLKTGRVNIGDAISKSKKTWYKTKEGKKFAKRIGKINSEKMKEFNKTAKGVANIERNAKLHSIRMKEKIVSGRFTPPITNTFTHWDAVIDNHRFRSSWEACFWNSNKHLQYESIECRTKKQSNGRVYVGDFFDADTKTLYEIKPKKFYLKQSEKIDALIAHCNKNGYKFKWVNEYNIIEYINETDFDTYDKIKQLNKLKNGIKTN